VIDTHCHLLHSLDDGPKSEEESIVLARQLADVGVTFVVCTPHFSRRFPTSFTLALERLVRLEAVLTADGIPISLALASEVSPAFAVSRPADELAERSIDGRFLLVEIEADTPATFLTTAVEQLSAERLTPIFAHPERCLALRGQPRLLEEARASGALVQVVAPSLTGRWGGDVGVAAWQLVDAGLVDLLASDSHRPARSGTHLERATALIAERHGPDLVRNLTERAPARVVGAHREA
jgi:protein-tyrosine phosphatase